MTDVLSRAKAVLLAPANLDESQLQRTLDQILNSHIDHADLYFQGVTHESWVLEDGIVKDASFDIDCGVGVRAMSGEKTGFAYADEIALPALMQSADAVRSIARQGGNQSVQAWQRIVPQALYSDENPIHSLTEQEKVALLQQLDQEARRLDPRVKQVIASLSAVHETILFAASDGRLAADVRPLIRIDVSVVMEDNGRLEKAGSGGGGRFGFAEILNGDHLQFAKDAVHQAQVKLQAKPAPAGTMPVVLGPGWPGVLLHEAVGHGLEADFNRKGSSAYSGRIGEKVASELCTIVDNGSMPNRRGSLSIDDEGIATQCTTLIENGILKNYMQDTLNARLMGVAPTGNGRRESYADVPMPRMTNTYMLAGQSEPEEIIASVKNGLYAVNFDGGQVDITSGKFVFSASEAYLIENGKVTTPVKGATLIGNGPEAMGLVSMVGNDLQLDKGVGICGKEGQSVPVGVGQPTLKIDALTVGGTQ